MHFILFHLYFFLLLVLMAWGVTMGIINGHLIFFRGAISGFALIFIIIFHLHLDGFSFLSFLFAFLLLSLFSLSLRSFLRHGSTMVNFGTTMEWLSR